MSVRDNRFRAGFTERSVNRGVIFDYYHGVIDVRFDSAVCTELVGGMKRLNWMALMSRGRRVNARDEGPRNRNIRRCLRRFMGIWC